MKTALFFIEPLSNLHVGSGEINYGLVDNLIQRDPVTGLPTINSSSLKGALREHFEQLYGKKSPYIIEIFGSEPKENDAEKRKQGALRFFEADMLSLAVRTTGNNLAYVNASSKGVMERQTERMKHFGIASSLLDDLIKIPTNQKVYIEDIPEQKLYCDTTGKAFAAGKHLAFVSEDELKCLCNNNHLPVISRNCLEDGQSGNLFYEQVLPRYSHLTTIIMGDDKILDEFCKKLNGEVVQIGGNATIGYGYCKFTQYQQLNPDKQ